MLAYWCLFLLLLYPLHIHTPPHHPFAPSCFISGDRVNDLSWKYLSLSSELVASSPVGCNFGCTYESTKSLLKKTQLPSLPLPQPPK